MEKLKQIYDYLIKLPIEGKVLTVIIITLLSILLLFFSSCGSPKVTLRDSEKNNISINNNPTTTNTIQLDSVSLSTKF